MLTLNFYDENITDNTDSEWISAPAPAGNILGGWFFIDGTAGAATYTLFWRPAGSSDDGMVLAQYELLDKSTEIMLQVHIPEGEMKVTVASGSAINSMPKFLWLGSRGITP